MPKVIIGIHGLANKPPKTVLKEWWEESIREELKKRKRPFGNIPFKMVYWANFLYKYRLHDDNKYSFDDYFNEQPYRKAKPGALKEYQEGWLDYLRQKTQSIFDGPIDTLKQTMGMDFVTDALLEKKLKDLHFYYSERKIDNGKGKLRSARLVLQENLEEVLVAHKNYTIMLISHSMGSIIAYDVLRNLGRKNKGAEVSHFVTIGSPLGLPHVKGKIESERNYNNRRNRVRTPSIVTESWVNFADRRDPVAFDTHLSDDYGPNSSGVQVHDDLIANDYTYTDLNTEEEKQNYHKSYGYLRTPELADHIASF